VRSAPRLRFAAQDEGAVIKALCAETKARIGDWLDWTQPLAQNWILAEYDRPVGCIQINYGVPIGRMEFLQVSPLLTFKQKALVVRNLCYAAHAQLKRHGSQAVATSIDHADPSWQRVVERRGAVPFATGTIYLKRL
jgi:hypothetical protein